MVLLVVVPPLGASGQASPCSAPGSSLVEVYLRRGLYAEAKECVVSALGASSLSGPRRAEAEALLARVLDSLAVRQDRQDAARRQLYDAREAIARGELRGAEDSLKRAVHLARKNEPLQKELAETREAVAKQLHQRRLWVRLREGWSPVLDWGLVFVAALGFVLACRAVRWVRAGWMTLRRKWIVRPIDDPTGLSVADLLLESLLRWGREGSPLSVGLLRGNALSLPGAVHVQPSAPDVAFTVEALPTLRGVQLDVIARMFSFVPEWFRATQPWVRGTVRLTDEHLRVVLTCRRFSGRVASVVHVARKDAEPSEIAAMVESVTFKMYHVISKDASSAEADQVDELRRGLKRLEAYAEGAAPAADLLEAAREFEGVRRRRPGDLLAGLYQGIALDLAERHDEAITLFRTVSRAPAAAWDIRASATYNEAVARFRKYKPHELEEAERLLRRTAILRGWELVSKAALANVIAHKPIFWRVFCPPPEPPADDHKSRCQPVVWRWLVDVDALANEILGRARGRAPAAERWTPAWREALRWAAYNAKGNVRLYYAINYLTPTTADEGERHERARWLNEAFEHFQICEAIAPARVETLTNLATVHLYRREFEECRRYCDRALEINPAYEYAAYRKCQSWLDEGKVRELRECLLAWQHPRKISSFEEIYVAHFPL